MKIRFKNVLVTTMLMFCTMIVVCTMVYADSGFVNMGDGATCTVGQPFTITFVAGYYSSSGKLYATIEIVSPDHKVQSEEFPYQNMYDQVKYTFTPDQVGIYIIKGYCSREWKNYISRYPVERYVMQKDRETAVQEAVLNVEPEKKSGGKETTGKEAVTISKAPSSVKAKAKKNKVTVSWKKINNTKKTKNLLSQIRKVEIQYDTDRSFANAVTRSAGKNKTKIVLKLQRKKTFYVRVRYRGSEGVSHWSTIRRVQVK